MEVLENSFFSVCLQPRGGSATPPNWGIRQRYTGTPEVGGLTPVQALEIVRGLRGLNIVGGDVVEVNPQFDSGGVTALMAANILYEMLCVLPGVKYKDNILKYSKDWA